MGRVEKVIVKKINKKKKQLGLSWCGYCRTLSCSGPPWPWYETIPLPYKCYRKPVMACKNGRSTTTTFFRLYIRGTQTFMVFFIEKWYLYNYF